MAQLPVTLSEAEGYFCWCCYNHPNTASLNFIQARCPSWCPTNCVKGLKAFTV